MSVHTDSRRVSRPAWKPSVFTSTRHVTMAPSSARPEQSGQVHVQAAHCRYLLVDTKRCEYVPGLATKSRATPPAPDHCRSKCHIADLTTSRTQERHDEPSHCQLGKSCDITSESHSQYQLYTGVSWPAANGFPWSSSSCSYLHCKPFGSEPRVHANGCL